MTFEEKSLEPPGYGRTPSRFWPVVGWIAYSLVGLLVSIVSLVTEPWFGLVVALCVIFGPKVWRSMR